jgi:hypothetical protein
MRYFYASWIAESGNQLKFGSVISCEEDYFNIMRMIKDLSDKGLVNPTVVAFHELERGHASLIMGEDEITALEDKYRRSRIKPI